MSDHVEAAPARTLSGRVSSIEPVGVTGRSHPAKRWLFVVIVLLALGMAVDAGARWYTQNSVEATLRQVLGDGSVSDVSLDGWPFITHVAGGTMPSLKIAAEEIDVDSLVISSFTVELEDVAFSPTELAADPEDATIEARSGRGIVAIEAEQFSQAARDQGYDATVSFNGTRVTVESAGRLYTDEVDFRLKGRRLMAYPSEIPEPITVALPHLGRGISYESVEIRDSLALMTLRFQNATLPLDLEQKGATYQVCRDGRTSASVTRSC